MIKKYTPFLIGALAFILMGFKKKSVKAITIFNGKMVARKCDAGGCGYFGADRDGGTREHLGQDLLCVPGSNVFAAFDGTVQRTIDPYGDGKFSGLQILCTNGITLRIMYMNPLAGIVGQKVKAGQLIGTAQNISLRYGSHVPAHLHVETIVGGKLVDPAQYLF